MLIFVVIFEAANVIAYIRVIRVSNLPPNRFAQTQYALMEESVFVSTRKSSSRNGEKPSICLGIDLGTSNTTVAVWDTAIHHPKILRLNIAGVSPYNSAKYHKLIKSEIFFWSPERSEVGGRAVAAANSTFAGNDDDDDDDKKKPALLRSIKRVFSVKYETLASDPQRLSSLPFSVVPDPDPQSGLAAAIVHPLDHPTPISVTPTRAASIILGQIKKAAEKCLKVESITSCVVGVPSHFGLKAREEMLAACRDAGFDEEEVSTFSESSAAAISYGLFVGNGGDGNGKMILVFDMGGGTTDITVATLKPGTKAGFKLITTVGDERLGGDDIDELILDWFLLCNKIEKSGTTTSEIRKLRSLCSAAKIALCGNEHDDPMDVVEINFKSLKLELTKLKFDEIINEIVSKAGDLVDKAVAGCCIEEVVLVGGGSRVGAIRQMLSSKFPEIPDLCKSIDPHDAVALGLAVRGGLVSGSAKNFEVSNSLMMDILPHDIGVVDGNGKRMQILLKKNSKMPCSGMVSMVCEEGLGQSGVVVEVGEDVGIYGGEGGGGGRRGSKLNTSKPSNSCSGNWSRRK